MSEQDVRWEQRFTNFKKALAKLTEVVVEREDELDDLSELEKEGLIQRFEYTFELAWKTLQDLLRHKGYLDIAGPNPVLKQAFEDSYITNNDGWTNMKKSRELTSHTYNSDLAEEIVDDIIHVYYPLLIELSNKLEEERYGGQSNLFGQ